MTVFLLCLFARQEIDYTNNIILCQQGVHLRIDGSEIIFFHGQ